MVAGTAVPCRYGADHPKLVRLDLNQPAIPQLPAAG
jgi:hypothetical protein